MSGRSSSPQQTAAQHPAQTKVEHDLIDEGDLQIGPSGVARSDSLLIVVRSESAAAMSVSVKWLDEGGNVFQSESASDLSLSSTTEGWARLTRKAPKVLVTITDESGGAENLVNAFVDTEP